MWSCSHARNTPGQIGTINSLLKHGANVKASDRRGMTPLMYAASYAAPDVVKMLIVHGADPKLRDGNGHTAMWWAKSHSNAKAARVLEGAEH